MTVDGGVTGADGGGGLVAMIGALIGWVTVGSKQQ